MITPLKQIMMSALSFCLSTSVVFAAPGMSNYFSDRDQLSKDIQAMEEQESKFIQLLSQASASASSQAQRKQQILEKLDKDIASAEEKNETPQQSIARIHTQIDEMAKANRANVTAILKDKPRFDRIYFALNKKGHNVSRAELTLQLKQATSTELINEVKELLEKKIMQSGSLANLLKDIKHGLETGNLASLKHQTDGRSIASEPGILVHEMILSYLMLGGFLGAAVPIFILMPASYIALGFGAGIGGALVGGLIALLIIIPLVDRK